MIYYRINPGLELCFAIPSNEEQHGDETLSIVK